jgi:hypothetical protein
VLLLLPATSLSGTVQQSQSGLLAVSLPRLTTSISATLRWGRLTASLPTLATSLSGTVQQTQSGPLAVSLPALATGITAVLVHQGAFTVSLGVPPMMLTRYAMFGCESRGGLSPRLPGPVTSIAARVPDPPGTRSSYRAGRWVSVRLPSRTESE